MSQTTSSSETTLTCAVTSTGAHRVLTVSGELDVATSPQLQAALQEVLGSGSGDVVIDLDAVTFIDSTALGVLVAAYRRVTGDGNRFVLVCNERRCLRVMEITGLTRLFTFAPSVAEATSAPPAMA